MSSGSIPKTQTVALVRELGGAVEFQDDYPVPVPGHNEVLAKVLYSGVCQSGEYDGMKASLVSEKDNNVNKQIFILRPEPQLVQTAIPSPRSSSLMLVAMRESDVSSL